MSITEAKIANGAITPGKLAAGAVGTAAVADRSVGPIDLAAGAVGGAQIADRSLGAADVAPLLGTLRARVGVDPETGAEVDSLAHTCWAGEPRRLWPEREGADISGDLVIVNADDRWPLRSLSLHGPQLGDASRFVLVACNPTRTRRAHDARRLPLRGHRPAVARRAR